MTLAGNYVVSSSPELAIKSRYNRAGSGQAILVRATSSDNVLNNQMQKMIN